MPRRPRDIFEYRQMVNQQREQEFWQNQYISPGSSPVSPEDIIGVTGGVTSNQIANFIEPTEEEKLS